MKVLLATQKPFSPQAVEGIAQIIKDGGHSFEVLEKYEGEKELAEAVKDVNALIVRSDLVTEAVIKAAPELKIVVRAGAGFDNIELQAATSAGVVVMNTPGQNANAVAELAIALMIFMARNQFTPSTGSEISGKTLGIQGFGNVGCLIAAKAAALGMNVKAFDPVRSAEDLRSFGVEPVESLERLYSECNYVSLNVPLLPSTERSVGERLIGLMPKGALLVNTARKEVVDEQGLEKALAERTDLKYATDVAPDNYAQLREDFGLRVYANSKKMGAQTSEANINAGYAAARQIVDYFATGNTKFQVNR
ncbi:MAG: NAD(P)-dependent oxidoreductase [Candidatus Cryptobacteroides sp.]